MKVYVPEQLRTALPVGSLGGKSQTCTKVRLMLGHTKCSVIFLQCACAVLPCHSLYNMDELTSSFPVRLGSA